MLHSRSNLQKLCFLKQQSYHQRKLPCKEHAQQLPWNPSPSSYTLHGRSHAVYVVQAPVTLWEVEIPDITSVNEILPMFWARKFARLLEPCSRGQSSMDVTLLVKAPGTSQIVSFQAGDDLYGLYLRCACKLLVSPNPSSFTMLLDFKCSLHSSMLSASRMWYQ